MPDAVLYDVARGVATITLNRPEALNACTVAVKEGLLAALREARDDDGVRAVVLTGAGRGFCVGQDLRQHAELISAGSERVENTVRDHFNPITLLIATMPKPVIAAVNGMAAGAGASMAFAADFRIAADTAGFLMAFARVGLGADTGASWTLQRLVGYGRAAALLLLAEPVSAEQALEMGLVNAVVPAEALAPAVQELAERLAAGPTVAYAAIKSGLAFAATAGLPDALQYEEQLQARCGVTADHHNATAAFLAKQTPVFEGR